MKSRTLICSWYLPSPFLISFCGVLTKVSAMVPDGEYSVIAMIHNKIKQKGMNKTNDFCYILNIFKSNK